MTEKTLDQLVEDVKSAQEKSLNETKEIAQKALSEAKSTGELAGKTKEAADEALIKMGELQTQLTEIEQKMARTPDNVVTVDSYGKQVADSEQFKSYLGNGATGSTRIELKATTTTTAGSNWSQRDPEIVGLPRRELAIRDLLTVIPTDSGTIEYARQTVRTNMAAGVAEGAALPMSAYEWGQASVAVKLIGHLAKITRQAMDDAKQLAGEVDAEMRYGLALAEEVQLLTGDGTGQNLTGLYPNATAYAAPWVQAGRTRVDVMRLAMLQAALANYRADAMVLNPIDWDQIEATKTSEGAYLFAQPQGEAGPRLWGRPVVPTLAMAQDNFLTGAFKVAASLYDRMASEVVIASENADDFEKNLFTMRCQSRLALAIKRQAALVRGTFTAALA